MQGKNGVGTSYMFALVAMLKFDSPALTTLRHSCVQLIVSSASTSVVV